jgi:predicted permease
MKSKRALSIILSVILIFVIGFAIFYVVRYAHQKIEATEQGQ